MIGVGLRRHLDGLGEDGRSRLEAATRKSLARCWNQRHDSYRAPQVIRANVTMLRTLRTWL